MKKSASFACLSDSGMRYMAEYFRALSEPMRLRILNALRFGPVNVGDMATRVQSSQANISRHLTHLKQQGFVIRKNQGNNVYYEVAHHAVYELCDIVCKQLAAQWEQETRTREQFTVSAEQKS